MVYPAQADSPFVGFEGRYTVVDFRKNSTVAAPAGFGRDYSEGLGKVIEVFPDDLLLEELSCDEWALRPAEGAWLFAGDRLLADLHFSPDKSIATEENSRIGELYELSCEGEYLSTIYRADSRVLIATLDNEEIYMVLEKTMEKNEILRLQGELRNSQSLTAETPGVLDDVTLEALRSWIVDHFKNTETPIPLRPAITLNLLNMIEANTE